MGRGHRNNGYTYEQKAWMAQQQEYEYIPGVTGHQTLEQQYPGIKNETLQVNNAAQYHHDNIAERYLNAHEAAGRIADGLESAGEAAQKLNGQG